MKYVMSVVYVCTSQLYVVDTTTVRLRFDGRSTTEVTKVTVTCTSVPADTPAAATLTYLFI